MLPHSVGSIQTHQLTEIANPEFRTIVTTSLRSPPAEDLSLLLGIPSASLPGHPRTRGPGKDVQVGGYVLLASDEEN